MKYKYTAYFPVSATVEVELESDEILEGQALVDAMYNEARFKGSGLCHQCAGNVQTDLEIDYAWVDKNLKTDDISVIEN